MLVRFSYQPPTAGNHEVGLAGDFTHWKIFALQEYGGVYHIDLELEPGSYLYKFIVDGVWQRDMMNPLFEGDPFGGENSRILVTEPARLRSKREIQKLLKGENVADFFSCHRESEDLFEIRFAWFEGFADDVFLCFEEQEVRLYPLGIKKDMRVWSAMIRREDFGDFCLRLRHKGKTYYHDTHGFFRENQPQKDIRLSPDEKAVFKAPDWLDGGVIYQIFMDRFYNGDASKNQDFQESYYENSRSLPPMGQYLPKHREYFHFVEDWYDTAGLKQSPWLPEGNPDWWSFYGGDIPGVVQKLDYLTDLGVNILYFNPLWEAKSNHKYDAANFARVDPHFGCEAELKELVAQAHKRGMKVVLDVAFNHSGESFWAFRDTVEKGPDSPYWDWYDWHIWPLPEPLPPDFQPKEHYQCWWGIKDMPDLNFDLARSHPFENYVRDIENAEVNWPLVNHVLESAEWWIAQIGMDGFRLDVPDEVPWWFWELFNQRIKAIKPDTWLVGEIWYNAEAWVSPRYFDSVMNYAYFKNPALEFFVMKAIAKAEFERKIEEGLAAYPRAATRAMMNLLGSHDTIRIMEIAEGETILVKRAVFFQMSFPGVPHIYYGDEIGMFGGKDPDNRRPFYWKYSSDEAALDLRDFYRCLIALRRENALLQKGRFEFIKSPQELLAFRRYDETGSVTCLINLSEKPQFYGQKGKIIFAEGEIEELSQGLRLAAHTMCVIT